MQTWSGTVARRCSNPVEQTISCAAERKAAVGASRSKLDRGYDRVADFADIGAETDYYEDSSDFSNFSGSVLARFYHI